MRYILAVDMGTTAFKASVFDENGMLTGNASVEYDISSKHAGWAEVDAETYIFTFKKSISGALKSAGVPVSDIICITMSAQGETTLFLDSRNSCLRPAVVWLDNRAGCEAEKIVEKFGIEAIQKNTGQTGADAIWPGAKILWLSENERDAFGKISKIIQLNGYFGFLLTGKFAEDDSLLGSSIYWNINTREYWQEMLNFLGINSKQLPEIVAPGTIIGEITEQAAAEFGLAAGTKVSIGAIDLVCGAVGTGNVRPGIFSESTGSALCSMTMTDEPVLDPNRQIPCYCGAAPGKFMLHSYATGGMMMRWYRDMFCQLEISREEETGKNAYDQLDEIASEIPAGSDGLVILPHLQGSGPPDLNPNSRAVFCGMTIAHTKGHIARAIMESVAVVLKRMIDGVESLGVSVDRIISYSGGAKSDLWEQIKADVTGLPVYTTSNDEDACGLGAVMIAGTNLGIWNSIEEASDSIVRINKKFIPDEQNRETYDKLIQDYKLLMNQMKPVFS